MTGLQLSPTKTRQNEISFIYLFCKMGRGICDILTSDSEILYLYTTFLLYFVSW